MCGLAAKSFFYDVGAGWRIGGRRDRDELDDRRSSRAASARPRYSGRKSCPHCETQWASSMANTVGSRLRGEGRRAGAREALGRDIKEAIAAAPQARLDRRIVFAAVRGIQGGGGNSTRLQLLHLVAHQGDQRRDDDGQPLAHDRGQLIEERFADPVGMTARIFSPANTALRISSCPGRNPVKPNTRSSASFASSICAFTASPYQIVFTLTS